MSLHGKRKEIYKYEAPWTVYAMNWSVRPDKRFRLALGSFVEEYNNKVGSPAWGSLGLPPSLSGPPAPSSSSALAETTNRHSLLQAHLPFRPRSPGKALPGPPRLLRRPALATLTWE